MNRTLGNFENPNGDSYLFMLRAFFWWAIQNLVFKSFLVPSRARVFLLKLFGAKIGVGVFIRRGVRVHFPWNLSIGDNCWIGEDAWFINHEKINVASNVCISQSAIICSSSHDFLTESLSYKHFPIEISDGGWICVRAVVLAGSKVGRNSVVSAGEVFSGSLPDKHVYIKGTARPIEKLM